MGMTVVVVEDDPAVRYALKLVLEDAGYAVIDGSGMEVVTAIITSRKSGSTIRPSAVVADFRLDLGITGITVIRCIEKLCGSDFRAVVVTGDTGASVITQVRSAGLTLLHKPVSTADLLAAIEPLNGIWHRPAVQARPQVIH